MKQQQVKLFSLVMVVALAMSLVLSACAVPATAPAAPAGGEAAATEAAAPESASAFKPVWYAPAP
ncbi:MAG: dihydrolipoamide acetyltransferase, partial [Caldilinea sp.]